MNVKINNIAEGSYIGNGGLEAKDCTTEGGHGKYAELILEALEQYETIAAMQHQRGLCGLLARGTEHVMMEVKLMAHVRNS